MIVFLLVIISALALLITFRLLSRGAGAPAATELPAAIDLPEKSERLLSEKNQLIDRLEKQVEAERSHRLEFEKVKELLSEEILRLKEQNRLLKTPKEP